MPYQIATKDEVIHIAFTGHLTDRDLEVLATEAARFERGAVVPHRISDMTGITKLDFRYQAIMELAEQRRQLTFPNPFKSAIIAHEPQHVGYARMFQTLNDNPQIAIRIFPDAQSANAWITGEPISPARETVAAN